MPRHLIGLLIVASSVLSACAPATGASQAVSPAAAIGRTEQAVARAEQEWTDAIARKDLATIERVVADDYVGIVANGQQLTKADHLNEVRNRIYDVDSVALDHVHVRLLGDVALVTYGQTEKSRYRGQDISGRSLYTDVFAKRHGSWQVVASHANRLPQ